MAVLTELKEKRRQEPVLNGMRYHRVFTCPWAAAPSLLPALGTTMASAYEGDASALLISAPIAVETATGSAILYLTYEKLENLTGGITVPSTWTYLGNQETGDHLHGDTASLSYEVPNTVTRQVVRNYVPDLTGYPGSSLGRYMQRVFLRPSTRQGKKNLTLYFEPLRGVVDPNRQRIVLGCDYGSTTFTYSNNVDLDGWGLNEGYYNQKGFTFYARAILGGVWPHYSCRSLTFTISMWHPLVDVSLLSRLSDTVNSQPFGGLPARTLWYTPGRSVETRGVKGVFGVQQTHYFRFSAVPWNEIVKTGYHLVTDYGKTTAVIAEDPKHVRAARLFNERDWSDLARGVIR